MISEGWSEAMESSVYRALVMFAEPAANCTVTMRNAALYTQNVEMMITDSVVITQK